METVAMSTLSGLTFPEKFGVFRPMTTTRNFDRVEWNLADVIRLGLGRRGGTASELIREQIFST